MNRWRWLTLVFLLVFFLASLVVGLSLDHAIGSALSMGGAASTLDAIIDKAREG